MFKRWEIVKGCPCDAVGFSKRTTKQATLSKEFETEAIAHLKSGESLTGKDGILTPLIKQIIEVSLEGEIEAHLAEPKPSEMANRRDRKISKLLKTGTESFKLETPRDRAGKPLPQIVKKRQTVLNESLDNKSAFRRCLKFSIDDEPRCCLRRYRIQKSLPASTHYLLYAVMLSVRWIRYRMVNNG